LGDATNPSAAGDSDEGKGVVVETEADVDDYLHAASMHID
jgi:hypothetical protein